MAPDSMPECRQEIRPLLLRLPRILAMAKAGEVVEIKTSHKEV